MKKIRLGDVATYINGYAFKPSDWSNDGVPIIRIQDLTGNSYQSNRYSGKYESKYEIMAGDVLISWSASLGVYVWQGEKAVLNQHIFKVVFDKKEVDKNFFVHQTKSIMERATAEVHGATMKHLTKPIFDALPFYLPTVTEQKRIATELDKITDLIDKRKKQLEKLDEFVKSRFIELFGGIHDSKMYPYKMVKELTEVISGGTPSRDVSEYWEEGTIPWVKTTELHNNVVTKVEEYITEKGLNNSSAKIVPVGTVLVAMYGQGKTRGMTAYLEIKACTNQACACILPSDKINQKFLWYFFILSYDNLRDLAKGGNQPNLNGNMIKTYPILYPPIELQNQFAAFVEQVDKSKFEIKQSLEKLELLKKALMQKYFG